MPAACLSINSRQMKTKIMVCELIPSKLKSSGGPETLVYYLTFAIFFNEDPIAGFPASGCYYNFSTKMHRRNSIRVIQKPSQTLLPPARRKMRSTMASMRKKKVERKAFTAILMVEQMSADLLAQRPLMSTIYWPMEATTSLFLKCLSIVDEVVPMRRRPTAGGGDDAHS